MGEKGLVAGKTLKTELHMQKRSLFTIAMKMFVVSELKVRAYACTT